MKDYLLNKLMREAVTPAESSNIPVPETTPQEENLVSTDDDAMKKIITDEFIRRGIDIDDISTMSSTSIIVQQFMQLFERTADILSVQNIESSILTAQKNTTLYNQLIQHTDDIVLARPSKTPVFVKIPFSEIIKYGKSAGPGKWKFMYTTDNSVLLDGKPFIPEYDIELQLTKTALKDELKVQYQTADGYKNIPTQRIMDTNGNYYGVFKVPFAQITIEMMERTFSGEQLERFILKTKNPISDFFMTYKDSTMDTPIVVDSKLYYTRGTDSYLRYRIHSNTKLSLSYIYAINNFKPKAGGKLNIALLTTTGENIRYRGKPDIEKRYPENLMVEYLPVGEEFVSTGGTLASDDKEYLRSQVRKLKGTVLRIDTESDLKTYLGVYPGKSTFHPRLIINDIMRVFNIYTLMSFENNKNTFTVPTTSGDVLIPLDRLTMKKVNGSAMYDMLDIKIESIQSKNKMEYRLAPETPTAPGPGETIYNYAIPFHLTYNDKDNYIRCLLDSSYNIPYDTYCIYDSDHTLVPTRFVNTTLRMNNYEDTEQEMVNGKYPRKFSVSTEIRSDNDSYTLNDVNFDSEIILEDNNGREVRVKMSRLIDQGKDNKYTLEFDLDSDRRVYDKYFEVVGDLKNDDGVWETDEVNLIPINQPNAKLNLYTNVPDGGEGFTKLLVATFKTDMDMFIDVSRFMYLQSVLSMETGELKLILCPLVEYEFFDNWRNKENINSEMTRIFNFIEEEIYTENGEYNATGYNLRDRQETLFTSSIKFVRTHGRSKFLELSNSTPLTNLQIAPSNKYRLINNQFSMNRISSEYNKFLTNHDFLTGDLHMNDLVADLLLDYSEDLDILQFVTFGKQYNDTDHMIIHNSLNYGNNDIPESVSLRPKYDEELGVYTYDVNYELI